MTDLRKAAEMALDAMLSEYSTGGENKYSPWDVIEALRQALAQTEQGYIKHDIEIPRSEQFIGKREWVWLTEEEVDAIRKEIFEKYKKALFVTRDVTSENDYSAFNFYRAIEEKLRIKND